MRGGSVTPEGVVKRRVDQVLKQFKAYYHKPVVNGLGKPTLDYVGCHAGRFFGIETKAGNKGMTERQKITAAEMEAAGGKVFLINEATGTDELVAWLQTTGEENARDA